MTVNQYLISMNADEEVVVDVFDHRGKCIYNSVRNGIRHAGFALTHVPEQYKSAETTEVKDITWFDRFGGKHVTSKVLVVKVKDT